jgi:putative heme-binding domain-containing protein
MLRSSGQANAEGVTQMTYLHGTVLGAVSVSSLFLGMLQAPTGDASRGRTAMESGGCFDCHRINDRGARVGPNLSDIGGRRTPEALRQALVAPDDEVLPENRSVRVVTGDGTATVGRLLNQDAISVQLITAKDELRTYLKNNLREYGILDKGLMPSTQGKLTDAQVADLVAYLMSLR